MRGKLTSAASILVSVLLILIANGVAYELDPRQIGAKYWPSGTQPDKETLETFEKKEFVKRNNVSPQKFAGLVRKMPADESEKFLDSYWELLPPGPVAYADSFTSLRRSKDDEMSRELQFLQPYALHNLIQHSELEPAHLFRRQFSCPQNYYQCISISAPAFCCRNDQQCARIQDTGFGTVGCCPNGQTCTGGLNGCTEGQIACSKPDGGGCCVLGYKCTPQGCILDTGGNAPTPTTTSLSGAQTTQACSAGYYACPSSLAGGCCPIGRSCGVSLCPASTGTPVIVGNTCPTGFYSCGPEFNGGCCRIGRDCGVTNCPVRAGSSDDGNGQKAAATTGVLQVPNTGQCANGWHTCPPSLNGGCCPSGYICAASNCPASTLGGAGLNILPPETKAAPLTASAATMKAMGQGIRWVVVLAGVVAGRALI